ncbi:MAG: S-layer homology domain-containing protein [Clostridiales bacterium]|uniref:S-layer homology domain-containing protein n=1 Tax=Flavonifractor porci TaxID=3133422 RepID=UPI0030AD75B8|nr:S-layer homology domain-containing protein [Clostridiales bacterium]
MQAKKPLALLLSLSMGLSMGSPALAAARETSLPDVGQSWAADSIHRWLEAGLVEGDDQGLFRPAANLTRGELATIFVRLLGLSEKAPNHYADLKGDEWYADAILKCTAAGILEGDGANCNATHTITRQETMVMFARAMGIREEKEPNLGQFVDGGTAAGWAAGYLAPLAELGILSGVEDGSHLAPMANIDRASIMALMDKAVSDYITGSAQVEAEDEGRFVVVNAGQSAARSGAQVEVSGQAAGLVVAPGSAGAKITAQDLTAATVKVDAPVELTLSGSTSAGYMSVNAEAQLAVEKEASVKELALNAAAQVDNQGSIDKASVNADGVVLDGRLPGSLEVTDGVDQPTDSEGNQVGGDNNNGGSGGGNGGGSGGGNGGGSGGGNGGGSDGDGDGGDGGQEPADPAPSIAQVSEEEGKVTIRFSEALYTKEDGVLTKIGSSSTPEGDVVSNEALQSAGYVISGDVQITNLYVDNETEFVWTFDFNSAKLGDGMRYGKELFDEAGNSAGYLTARRHVALKDDEGRTPYYVWTVAFEQEAEADVTAPVLEKESVTLLGDDDTLTLTVPVSDDGELAYLEIDHSLEASFPEFTVEAKSYEFLDEESGLGYTSAYTDTQGEQKWEITLNPVATALLRQAADGSPMTFYFSVKDKAGNQFGSMYFVDEEMTVSDVSVPLDTTAPTVVSFAIDDQVVEDGATVNFDEGQEFTSLTVTLSEAVVAGDQTQHITIDGHEFGTFVIDEADPTKLHITVTNHNGNKYVEGTFKFDLAAGALKDASDNENEEQSYTIHFTKNPGV